MTIFEETKILCDDLANFLILPIGEEFIAFQTEQMRKEGSSSQTGSELIGRQSKFLTPVDTLLKSTPQIESLLVPRTSDSAPEFNVQHYQISTPLRTDHVLMQQKNLYEETVWVEISGDIVFIRICVPMAKINFFITLRSKFVLKCWKIPTSKLESTSIKVVLMFS